MASFVLFLMLLLVMAVAKGEPTGNRRILLGFISKDPHGRRLNGNANWVASIFAIASVSVSMGALESTGAFLQTFQMGLWRLNRLELSFKHFKWVYSIFFLE
jgi:hypothetical protein